MESLPAGPQSFVDGERVNAGIEVVAEIDEETVKREDIAGIQRQSKKVKKVKRLKRIKLLVTNWRIIE